MTINELRFAKLSRDAKIPTRKNPDDAGFDLYSIEEVNIAPHNYHIIGTGISVDIPTSYVGLVLPKSRNNFLLGGGVVDSGYQGEVLIKVFNILSEYLKISSGQAVAQLLVVPIETPTAIEVSIQDLYKEKSPRGETGGIAEQKKL